MNKIIQYIFLILLPIYPLWAYLVYTFTGRHIGIFTVLLFIALSFYLLIYQKVRFPKYLIFLVIFTLYHLGSVFINNLIPLETNWIYYILSDESLLACMVFFVIENTHFDEKFIQKMNRGILLLVIISLIVSIIQIKYPAFFVSPVLTTNVDYLHYLEQRRNFSIFSWVDTNSLGISFPILISILLSINTAEKITFPIAVVGGIIVSFLTRARYVMMSAIIVFSQLFFVSKIDFRKKIYILLVFLISLTAIIGIANIYGFDIQQVIDNRIMERGSGMASARVRILSYEIFMLKFPEHPWLGVGPMTRIDVVQLLRGAAPLIHVGYLSYLYFYGIVGSLFLFLAIFFLLKNAWIVGKKFMFWGSFYGLLSFCFANVTMVYFNLSEIGIILAVLYMRYFIEKSRSELSNTDQSKHDAIEHQ